MRTSSIHTSRVQNTLSVSFRPPLSSTVLAHHRYLNRTNPTSITLPRENLSFLRSFRTFKFPAGMLIGNFDISLMCSEAVAPLFKNSHIRSFFASITKPIVINVEPLFLIRKCPWNLACHHVVVKPARNDSPGNRSATVSEHQGEMVPRKIATRWVWRAKKRGYVTETANQFKSWSLLQLVILPRKQKSIN